MNNKEKINPHIKDIFHILGTTALIVGVCIAPPLTLAIGSLIKGERKERRKKDFKTWEKYNLPRLKQILRRLEKQKVIKMKTLKNGTKITLTKKGKTKILFYKLEEMKIKEQVKWDKKWRLIIYDIPAKKRHFQANFRRMLTKLKFLKLQNSVYLTPYPCEKEIEFLRHHFHVSKNIIYMIVDKIENDIAYKKYFGLE